MPRPKNKDEKLLLNCPVIIRLNEASFKRLEKMAKESNCKTVGEVARRIINGKHITLHHKDTAMNGPMEELALIRKELKAIGININQQTHYFHISQSPAERVFYVNKTSELYKSIDKKVERLLSIVNQLAELWLQK
ncbi:mobilization protein [Pedobacter sp. GSP4]|uniref:mobilization protein n=1 Tax=Pedobacter sp. GSP4 TaxID=3453716 RepID=UPI003EEC482B